MRTDFDPNGSAGNRRDRLESAIVSYLTRPKRLSDETVHFIDTVIGPVDTKYLQQRLETDEDGGAVTCRDSPVTAKSKPLA